MQKYVIDSRFSSLDSDLKNKIETVINLYNELLSNVDSNYKSYIRFSDYYDINSSTMDNINYFKEVIYDVKNEDLIQYCNYIVSILLSDILFIFNDEDFGLEDLMQIFDDQSIFDESLIVMEYAFDLISKRNNDGEIEFDFLKEDNTFKIMFTKLAYEDIKELPIEYLKTFVRKLYNPLATNKIIKLCEGVDHTNANYNTNYMRIQFSNDYRITFFRENNVTVILGVTLKSGKNADYYRYDYCAKIQDSLLKQVNDFLNEICTDEHIDTINYIKNELKNKVM